MHDISTKPGCTICAARPEKGPCAVPGEIEKFQFREGRLLDERRLMNG